STAAAYRELDRQRVRGTDLDQARVRVGAAVEAWRAGDLAALGRAFFNDLEPVARRAQPVLNGLIGRMHGAGAVGVVVRGSGPAQVALGARSAGARQGEVSGGAVWGVARGARGRGEGAGEVRGGGRAAGGGGGRPEGSAGNGGG